MSATSIKYRRLPDSWLGVTPKPTGRPFGRTVFIAGSGHSGSTLLDMLLGGHSKIASLGESIFLQFNARNYSAADRCTCGVHVESCPFWSTIEAVAQQMLGLPSDEPALSRLTVADPRMVTLRDREGVFRKPRPGERYPFRSRLNEASMLLGSPSVRRVLSQFSAELRLHTRVAVNLNFLYDVVRLATGKPVVVDSTKNPGYLKGVWMEQTAPVSVISVVRDGRAVCASRIRREGVSMQAAARAWVVEHIKRRASLVTIPRASQISVRYEDLTEDPQAALCRLCRWLGIEYEPAMLTFRNGRHNLGGNPMRHRSEEQDVVADTRWQDELSETLLYQFDRTAGWLNRRLGYPAALSS